MLLHAKSFGQGPALVILHGLFGSLDNWVSHARVLEKEYSVYLVDLRNHGRSFHHSEHNYKAMAEDVARWMDSEGIYTAHILGHSMGGKVAATLANLYPERIDKLIIADMGIKAYTPHHTLVLDTLRSMDLSTFPTRKSAEEHLMQALNQDNVTVQFLLKGLGRDEQNGFEWKFNFPALDQNYARILDAVEIIDPFEKPTLFFSGANSNYVLPEDHPNIKKAFPNVTFQVMPNAGHWLHAENPPLFVSEVDKFLKG